MRKLRKTYTLHTLKSTYAKTDTIRKSLPSRKVPCRECNGTPREEWEDTCICKGRLTEIVIDYTELNPKQMRLVEIHLLVTDEYI